MTVEQWNGMTQREKDEACAKAERWTYEGAVLTRNPDTFEYEMTFDYPDYTDPRNYERLKCKAIEKDAYGYAGALETATQCGCKDCFATATPDQVCLASVLTLGRS